MRYAGVMLRDLTATACRILCSRRIGGLRAPPRRLPSLGILMLSLIAACGGGASPPGASVLERGLGQEPESMDPHLARSTQAHTVQRDLFEGLVGYSSDGRLTPAAAESWTVSDDGLHYVFRLRDEARWSNGDPLTAGDFVFSLRRLVDPATAAFYAESLSAIVNAAAIVAGDARPESLGVAALDDRTLTIDLERPTPYFLALLTHPSAFPVHEASVRRLGDRFSRPGDLVSNGAYVLDEWVLGSVIELSRNRRYRDDARTAIDRVRYHVIQQPDVELSRYRAGELDVTSTVPTDAFDAVREQFADELRVAPKLSVYFYGINLNQPELGGKPKLREALSMAIDREKLVAEVTGRGELPAFSFVPPGVDQYEAPELTFADMPADERRARARRLYEEAGYGPDNPLRIELRYNTSDTHRRIAVAVQQMWRDVLGFEVELINEEFRVLIANMRAMQITEIFRLSWDGDYNDAQSFLSLFETDNPSNMFGYSNGDFDRLLHNAARQTDAERRRMFLEEAERELLADHVVIPIYFPVSKHLVRSNVAGWQDNVLDYHYSQHLRFADADR